MADAFGGKYPRPLAAVLMGMAAGAAGTAAMDLYWFAKYKKEGGKKPVLEWEFSAEEDWEKISAPGKLGHRLIEGFTQEPLPPRLAPLVNNAMHWGYGVLWGGIYGIVSGSMRRSRWRTGIPFGAAVWLNGYAVLPLAKLYKPIWEYDAKTLAQDLGGHLTYGATTASVFALLRR